MKAPFDLDSGGTFERQYKVTYVKNASTVNRGLKARQSKRSAQSIVLVFSLIRKDGRLLYEKRSRCYLINGRRSPNRA